MKKLIIFMFSVLLLGSCDTGLVSIAIPDQNFEQALVDFGYDDVIDGKVLTANINSVDSLILYEKNISDLTGIEAFTSLEVFHCPFNPITNLDLSNNTALTSLWCFGTKLTSLDLSQNTALTTLWVYDNIQLTNLDISGCTALTILECFNNKLTNLDLSNNTALTILSCYSNQLTSLDLSQNTALTKLYCFKNKFDCDALKAKYGL